MSLRDRCLGVLIGLASGDRNGGPVQMAFRLSRSLIERSAFDPADVTARYVQWWREGAFDTGPVSARALALQAQGVSPRDASARVHDELAGRTAGCNPAHRAPPLAMFAGLQDRGLARAAVAEAQLTHAHPLAGDAAAAAVRLCRSLIRGSSWKVAIERAGRGRAEETRKALGLAREGPGSDGGYAPDVLRASAHFAGESSGFAEALDRSLEFAGPANYAPVLVGAFAGARWGRSAIPRKALLHVGDLETIEAAACSLAEGWPPLR
jgi:ADP-ribosylglycohydrolase